MSWKDCADALKAKKTSKGKPKGPGMYDRLTSIEKILKEKK